MSRYSKHILVIIFLLVLATRLYFAFSIPYFSSDDSYFHLRQIESIRETGKPIFEDALSYSGRDFIFSPLFHYILAFFALFMPVVYAAKVIPNIFAASLVFIFYLLAMKLTKSSRVSLFTAFLSGFVPVFFAETTTRLTPLCLAIPLIFLLVYALLNIKNQNWLYCYLTVLIFLSFMHPIVLLFILGLSIYLVLMLVEKLKQSREELEIAIFSIFFVLWAQFIVYKKLFIFHGVSIVWQNIPKEILSEHFAATTILGSLFKIGVIPFVIGLYIIYLFLFKQKQKDIYLVISFAGSAGILLWLRFIDLNLGLIFFGLLLVVLFAPWYKMFIDFVKKTKVSNLISLFAVLIFAAFLLLSVYPSFIFARQTVYEILPVEIDALDWIKENTPPYSTIIASVNEGNLLTGIAERKNVIDTDFFLQKDAAERLNDIERIYNTFSEIEAIDLMDKYGADYIYFSRKARRNFEINEIKYIKESKCFSKVYDAKIQVYKKLPECTVRVL